MKSVELFRSALRSKWKKNSTAATVLGVSDAMISDVLAGRRRISPWLAYQVERALNKDGTALDLLTYQAFDDLQEIIRGEMI
jgi:plasmid maintenance system antidote protein VapI